MSIVVVQAVNVLAARRRSGYGRQSLSHSKPPEDNRHGFRERRFILTKRGIGDSEERQLERVMGMLWGAPWHGMKPVEDYAHQLCAQVDGQVEGPQPIVLAHVGQLMCQDKPPRLAADEMRRGDDDVSDRDSSDPPKQ
jgi:hypothetical protein